MILSDFAREHTSITHGRDGRASTITVRAGCSREQTNSYRLLLSQQDASALVSLLESYERREGVTVVGDKGEGGKGKVPRLVVAVRALARGFCTDAPLSASQSTPPNTTPTVPTVPTAPRTVQLAPTISTTPAQRLMAGLATSGDCPPTLEPSFGWL
jgi:hypothetical protein